MEQLLQILDIVEQYSASTWLTFIGLIIFYIGVKAVFSEEEENVKPLYISFGAVFIIVALGLGFSDSFIERKVTSNQAFDALVENKRVNWVIRLISYSEDSEPYLSLNELEKLGKKEHEYVFVADYEELINYSITEAIYKMGGKRKGKNRASVIIFPLEHKELFPANAKGLLQVVQKVDIKYKNSENYKSFNFQENMSSNEFSDLATTSRLSWAWENYSTYFKTFQKVVEQLRNESFSALSYIGSLHDDWNEFGYSEIVGLDSEEINTGSFSLKTSDGTSYELENFGARAFLIKNHMINKIDNRILIDFSDLDKQKIPDFRGKFSKTTTF